MQVDLSSLKSDSSKLKSMMNEARPASKVVTERNPDKPIRDPYDDKMGKMYHLTNEELKEHLEKDKIKKAAEEAKRLEMTKTKVIKIVQEEAEKIKLIPRKSSVQRQDIKPEPITDVKIHPKSKPAILTVYRNNDKRNFDVHKPFKLSDFGLTELDKLGPIIQKKNKTIVKDLMTSLGKSCNLFVSLEGVRLLNSDDDDNECKAWLVQSIPTDMPQLPLVPGVLGHCLDKWTNPPVPLRLSEGEGSIQKEAAGPQPLYLGKSKVDCHLTSSISLEDGIADVLRWLAGNASHNLDIMAQYWQLVAHPDDPNSGDYGYSKEEMQSFGSNDGASVYKSIEEAADRNVQVILLHIKGVYPDYTREPSDLASGRPNVKKSPLPRYVDVHHTAGYPMITDPSHFHKPIQNSDAIIQSNRRLIEFILSTLLQLVLVLDRIIECGAASTNMYADWNSPYAVPVEPLQDGHAYSS
ncbi:hypothetical protein Tco_0374526 [Tanacetum coccineum]